MCELFDDLCAYDGKSVTLLLQAEAKHGAGPTYLSELVRLAASERANVSDGATWLLKAGLEAGAALTADQTGALISNLEKVTHWPAQLHICQLLDLVTVPAAGAAPLAGWLSGLVQHRRPFLRAWSMSALQALAAQHAGHAAQAEAALQAAKADPSASVRARARVWQLRQRN